ncbi:1208_t:CDS:2 [Diversispora eburnea]|uniref:tRNA pseudouridine(55) synthase n=1 Tax=Diversispora eburnea TaxID=1213867 RepID=A0A9N9C916_9GLOM|nr:1208_t:CDS:2 [Diversispora eburnea]
MAKKEKVQGLFAVNKPKGLTVHQVLEFINQTFRRHAEATRFEMTRRQVVELGTCMSLTTKSWATGVVVVGVNQGNRLLKEQEKMNEIIHATGMLGFSTDTKDFKGDPVKQIPASQISKDTLAELLPKLVGKVYNREIVMPATPPTPEKPAWITHLNTFGKKKKKRLLQEYTRPQPAEKVIEFTTPKKIYRMELLDFKKLHTSPSVQRMIKSLAKTPLSSKTTSMPAASPLTNLIKSVESKNPIFKVEIECSPSTSIERIIHDIGFSLNNAAYLLELERVKQGDFILHEDTLDWEQCGVFDNIYDAMNNWIRKVRRRELEKELGGRNL